MVDRYQIINIDFSPYYYFLFQSSLLQSIANMTTVFDFNQEGGGGGIEGDNGPVGHPVNGNENVFAGDCPWEEEEEEGEGEERGQRRQQR